MDGWVERAAHMPDRARRMALYRQADRRLVAEQVLLVPLAYGQPNLLIQPWVRGALPSRLASPSLRDVVVESHAGA